MIAAIATGLPLIYNNRIFTAILPENKISCKTLRCVARLKFTGIMVD